MNSVYRFVLLNTYQAALAALLTKKETSYEVCQEVALVHLNIGNQAQWNGLLTHLRPLIKRKQ